MKFKGPGHAASAMTENPMSAPVSTPRLFHWREYGAEFIGTGVMVFVGLSAIAIDFGAGSPMIRWIPDPRVRLLITAFFFAGGGTSVVYSPIGQRSGGHLNPAMSFAFWIAKKFPTTDALAYAGAQSLGALIGASIVKLCWRELALSTNIGLTQPGLHVTAIQAFIAETVMTFFLIAVVFSVLQMKRWEHYAGLAAGALVVLMVYIGAPISGTSINPARSLGPALVLPNLHFLWIYLVAPMLGAGASALTFRHRSRT